MVQTTLINSQKKEPMDADDWVGMIQTFKKIINLKVVENLKEMKEKLIEE